MLDYVLNSASRIISAIPFGTATWFVLLLLAFFIWLFHKAQRNPESPVDWEDLILDNDTNKVSPYKVGYLLGLIVATWVVISFADTGKLTFDIFAVYLSYLLGGAGWSAYVKSKTNGNQ